jgi:hypothetical protein
MKTKQFSIARQVSTALVLASLYFGTFSPLPAQTPPAGDTESAGASLPSGVQDVVSLTRAGLNEDVILAQIRSVGSTYQLSTDQVIYLSNAGVSQNVIKALISGGAPAASNEAPAPVSSQEGYGSPAPTAAPAAPAAEATPSAAVSFDYFHDQLAPYGNWVQVANYGWAWSPAVAAADGGWRPYADQGQWVYTDGGWYWQSQYPWGDIAFHYGRWYRDLSYGWLWVPDYTWAPAWVCWRNAEAEGYCGWAPLPPGARFVMGEGLFFDGRLAVDVDFGLRWDAFVFIGFDHFWNRDYRHFFLVGNRAAFMFRHSFIRNGYRMDHGRFVVDGLGRDRIARYTHRDVRVVRAGNLRAREERAHIQARRVEAVRAGARSPGRADANRGYQARPAAESGGRREAPALNRPAAPANQRQPAAQAKQSNAKPASGGSQKSNDKKKTN